MVYYCEKVVQSRTCYRQDLHIQHVRSVFPHVGLDSDLPIDLNWLAEALSGEYGIASLPLELMKRLTYFGLGIYR